jgi:hypothetical protein
VIAVSACRSARLAGKVSKKRAEEESALARVMKQLLAALSSGESGGAVSMSNEVECYRT